LNATWKYIPSTSRRRKTDNIFDLIMPRIISLITALIFAGSILISQEPDSLRKSIHQLESEYYKTVIKPAVEYPSKEIITPPALIINESRALTGRVLGWHPYWASSVAYQSYDFNSLSHIAYFSYEVDTATGLYSSIHEWNTTGLITTAHLKGTKVLLTVTNFGVARNTKLLSDTIKQKTLISTLISLLKSRNGDGVNFDLESVGSSQRNNLIKFIGRAVKSIKAELPLAEISMAAPAVDWNNSWDIKALSDLCDYLIIMGYDYYYSGSSTAGPVAPLETESYNVTRSVNTYLLAGVAPEKLMLGVPWYGYDWPVVNNSRKANATGSATARIYTASKSLAKTNGFTFDQMTKVPWVSYQSSSIWRQLWYDDTVSLALKYNLVNTKNMGGIGIWALSYEGGSSEIWRTIRRSFSPPDTNLKEMEIKIYPNPVHSTSKVKFYLTKRENVSVRILDMTGRVSSILFEGELDAGFQSVDFNSSTMGQGIYLCVLQVNKSRSSKKIIIIK
jgi:spore germination protein YaaH